MDLKKIQWIFNKKKKRFWQKIFISFYESKAKTHIRAVYSV
jgi:hypothetical protein